MRIPECDACLTILLILNLCTLELIFTIFTVGINNGLARDADYGRYGPRVSGRPFPHAHTTHEETVHVSVVLSVFVDDARGSSPDFPDVSFQPGKYTA